MSSHSHSNPLHSLQTFTQQKYDRQVRSLRLRYIRTAVAALLIEMLKTLDLHLMLK